MYLYQNSQGVSVSSYCKYCAAELYKLQIPAKVEQKTHPNLCCALCFSYYFCFRLHSNWCEFLLLCQSVQSVLATQSYLEFIIMSVNFITIVSNSWAKKSKFINIKKLYLYLKWSFICSFQLASPSLASQIFQTFPHLDLGNCLLLHKTSNLGIFWFSFLLDEKQYYHKFKSFGLLFRPLKITLRINMGMVST